MRLTPFLTGLGRSAAIAATVVLGTAALSSAATLKLTTSFDVVALPKTVNFPQFQQDTGGLDGSTFTLDVIFADMTKITNGFAAAESVSITVAGASVDSSNGNYIVADPVGLFPSAGLGKPQSFFGGAAGWGTFAIGNILTKARFDALGSFVSPGEGNEITLASLQNINFVFAGPADNSQLTNAANRQFDARNIVTTAMDISPVAPVPLPAALPLMLVAFGGLGGLSAFRRRRAAA